MANDVLTKFKEIVKKGHIPCRYKQEYSSYNADLVNCFEHACFNLNEKELSKINGNNVFSRPLSFLTGNTAYQTCENYLNFIADTGLDISKKRIKPILKKNQWVVTLYFAEDMSDFHFLLKEKSGIWTAKRGFTTTIDCFEEDEDRISLENLAPYFKEASYVLTNRYAEK